MPDEILREEDFSGILLCNIDLIFPTHSCQNSLCCATGRKAPVRSRFRSEAEEADDLSHR